MKLLRYVLLLAVIPIVVGHGGGNPGDWFEARDKLNSCAPVGYLFELAGGPAKLANHASELLKVRTRIRVATNEDPFWKLDEAPADGLLQRNSFNSCNGIKVEKAHVVVDGVSEVGSLGDAWLHLDPQMLKLTNAVYNSKAGVFFDVNFLIADGDYSLPQQSFIASSSQYMLAGGATGAEYLQIGSSADVYLNGSLILSSTANMAPSQPPLMFTANVGDVLRFIISGTVDTSELWLYKPSGQGIKLLHRARVVSTGVPLDVSYRIE